MSDSINSTVRRLRGSMEMALRGATPAERNAGIEAVLRLCASLAEIGSHAISNGRLVTDQLIRSLPPDLASLLQVKLIEISPIFSGAPIRGALSSNTSEPTVADLLRRRTVRQPFKSEKPDPPRNPYRVGMWVYNIGSKQVAMIEQRVPHRDGPNGPEHIYLMEKTAGAALGWSQFGIRLATPEEIEAELAERKSTKERLEREAAEWSASWEARWTTKRNVRGSCDLFAVAEKRQRRRSEMLLGRAWDGGDHVVFEAVDGAIRSRVTYGSKGAATRAYNVAISAGYTALDADEERFDRLCPALVRARPRRPGRRTIER